MSLRRALSMLSLGSLFAAFMIRHVSFEICIVVISLLASIPIIYRCNEGYNYIGVYTNKKREGLRWV